MAVVLSPFLLSFTFLISSSFFVPSLQHVNEAEPLIHFKNTINITKGDLNSWRAGTDPCNGKWFGIYCQNGESVTGIHVTRLGLTGEISVQDLKALTSLRTLRLDNNMLSGPLPPFHMLRGLKSLLLSNNSFSGEISDDFFKDMPQLKRLFLDNNHFAGQIPTSLMQLLVLEEIHLQGNQFSGQIPELTDANKILKSIDLSNNDLEGEIPKSISERKNLEMNFRGNQRLCGQPLNVVCDPSDARKIDPMTEQELSQLNIKSILISIVVLIIFFIIVGIISRRRRREPDFRMLSKEHLSDNEVVEVRVPETTSKKPSESTKKRDLDGSTKKGTSNHGKGSGMGDIIMVNKDRGSFGLPDLMKAAAEVLGNGSLGSAYKAVMGNGLAVVVKRIRDMNKLGKEAFDVEMRRLGQLRHPNILTPLAYHYRREEKLIVSEYMPKSSLLYVLHGDRGICHSELTWPTRLKIIQGVVRGMQFLHEEFTSYELPHGNLKSSNVLLSENYEPLISDYAFLPLLQPENATQSLFAFKTPEFTQNQRVSAKSDVYCLGIIVLEILTGKFPSQYLNNGKGGTDIVQWVQTSISEGKEEELIDPEIASNTESVAQMIELLRIGASCIATNPDERLDMKETARRIKQATT
ncbi:PREDICTED: pollen receptor-like kinase 3 [Tarenaya hassleriana]|uniref:pollen receptor-like kinase 3 n=1 Tax=Tarenaya hassleriana TaxID=28532 RepID=UPI00053C1A10|nr:PREDICTED: pollen receptor-like kinase 3 [Tarenaya hassleriana]